MKKLKELTLILLLLTGLPFSINAQTPVTAKDSTVYEFVDEEPTFKGGYEEWAKWLNKEVKYPKTAMKYDIQGTVFLRAIVTSEGKITNVKVTKGLAGGLSEEALRVVSKSPDWIPGKTNGKAVNVYITIPIKFVITDRKKKKEDQ